MTTFIRPVLSHEKANLRTNINCCIVVLLALQTNHDLHIPYFVWKEDFLNIHHPQLSQASNMASPTNQLASIGSDLKKFNAFLSETCSDLRDDLGWRGRECSRRLSDRRDSIELAKMPSTLKSIALRFDNLQQERLQLERLETQNQQLKVANEALKALPSKLREARRKQDKLEWENGELKRQLQEARSSNGTAEAFKTRIEQLKQEKDALNEQLQQHEKRWSRKTAKLEGTNETLLENAQRDRGKISMLERANEKLQETVNMFGPKPCKEPKCRGCQKRVYHCCSEYGQGRWVRF